VPNQSYGSTRIEKWLAGENETSEGYTGRQSLARWRGRLFAMCEALR
jgi:hypothetical protein